MQKNRQKVKHLNNHHQTSSKHQLIQHLSSKKNLGSFNLKNVFMFPHPQFSDLILKELLCDLLGLCITITLRDFDHFDTRQSLTLSDEAATGNGYGALEDAR